MRKFLNVLHGRAASTGDQPAVDDGTARLTYAELAARVTAAAEDIGSLPGAPSAIGLLGTNNVDYVVAQLAAWQAGKTLVPLPNFFHAAQIREIIRDAEISQVLCSKDSLSEAWRIGVPVSPISRRRTGNFPAISSRGAQIIYTSGSTGRPKGVLLEGAQLAWSARSLGLAISAHKNDTYLSVMPLALLLETLAAVMVPIYVGAQVRFDPNLSNGLFGPQDNGAAIASAVAHHCPTCMILVPQILTQWIGALCAEQLTAPDSLRFVAVGGAMISPALAARAWKLGIPVHEGYGLSECGSVVALNRPGARRPGTVGKPLPGLDVSIEDGEIVVRGPSVMKRYLHGGLTDGVWRTGDAGTFDADGNLRVQGRVDNVIVAPTGRNISPEWIESALMTDSRLARCIVMQIAGPHLTAFMVPTPEGEEWFAQASIDDVGLLVADCCREIPDYAVPRHFVIVPEEEFGQLGFLTGNGRIRRTELAHACSAILGAGADGAAPVGREAFE